MSSDDPSKEHRDALEIATYVSACGGVRSSRVERASRRFGDRDPLAIVFAFAAGFCRKSIATLWRSRRAPLRRNVSRPRVWCRKSIATLWRSRPGGRRSDWPSWSVERASRRFERAAACPIGLPQGAPWRRARRSGRRSRCFGLGIATQSPGVAVEQVKSSKEHRDALEIATIQRTQNVSRSRRLCARCRYRTSDGQVARRPQAESYRSRRTSGRERCPHGWTMH